MNINEFIAELPGGGTRSNLFRVIMPFPNFAVVGGETRKMSFLCKAASIPPSVLGKIEIPFQGRKIKVAGDREFGEAFTVTVINDTDFMLRNAFERWSDGINNHSSNGGLTNFSEYAVDGTVEQLDRAGNTLKVYTFRGMYPENISAIELAYDQENQIQEFTVALQYQFWEAATTS